MKAENIQNHSFQQLINKYISCIEIFYFSWKNYRQENLQTRPIMNSGADFTSQ